MRRRRGPTNPPYNQPSMNVRKFRPAWVSAASALGVYLIVGWGCDASTSAKTPAPAAETSQELTIDHIAPRRDFVGPMPQRFEWSAVKGADRYAIGIWDEVDRLRWRKDDIEATFVARPADLSLESGTYFWSVSGIRGGQQIADSGLSAFVVE